MKTICLALLAFLASCSNGKCCNSTAKLHDDGRAKPIVLIAPIIDSTAFDYPWNLSEEIESYLKNEMDKKGDFYLTSVSNFSYQNNPLDQDVSWVKKAFPSNEFVVFIEIVEHKKMPALKKDETLAQINPSGRSSYLCTEARVRVVDTRGESAKIILQELVKDSYFIPRNIIHPDYNLTHFGTKDYQSTPVGKAHAVFASIIFDRISDYILLAKSRG